MHKELIYIKGFAKGRRLHNTVKAISYASMLHEGQKRKSGEDYIEHPMRVCKQLISLGIDDDNILAASLLHDVVEDCNISVAELKEEFGADISDCVALLSKLPYPAKVNKQAMLDNYYNGIKNSKNVKAMLIKISDRCHNLSTMTGPFTQEKIIDYIYETRTYVYPLCDYVIDNYPEYSDLVYSMKYHMDSIIYAVNTCLEEIDRLNWKIEDMKDQSENEE